MRVTFKKAAAAELEHIRRWIARDNPARALSFIRELRARAEQLSDTPLRFPVAYQTSSGAVHKLTHGNYLIFYRVHRDQVEVLHFRHGAQQPPSFD